MWGGPHDPLLPPFIGNLRIGARYFLCGLKPVRFFPERDFSKLIKSDNVY